MSTAHSVVRLQRVSGSHWALTLPSGDVVTDDIKDMPKFVQSSAVVLMSAGLKPGDAVQDVGRLINSDTLWLTATDDNLRDAARYMGIAPAKVTGNPMDNDKFMRLLTDDKSSELSLIGRNTFTMVADMIELQWRDMGVAVMVDFSGGTKTD